PAGGLGYQSRLAMARAVFNGKPADASMGPAGSAWLAANRRSQVDDTAAAQWKTVMSDYTKEQTRPSLQQVNDIVQAARATGMAARGKIAQAARNNWDTPPLSALDAPEVQQVQSLLANPDPAVKGRVFNALSALPEDVRNATLAKIGGGRPDLMVSVAAGSMM